MLIVCLGLILLLAVLGLTVNIQTDTYKVYAWGESVTCTSVNEEYLQWDYLNLYQIKPNTHFSYSSTSAAYPGYALDRAFDGNFDTAFVGTKTINYNSSVQINAVFNKTTTVDRIIYKCVSYDGKASGFPTYLRLSWGNNYSESTLLETWDVPTGIVMFTFNHPVTTDRIRFEFADVSVVNNSVSGTLSVATAAELMFLQPENQYAAKAGDLFEDYRWTQLKSEYKNIDMLHDMKTQLSGYINYDTEFGPRIERALALMEGTAQYDSNREFATNDTNLRKITQYGNIINYARRTLKMDYAGTNKQPTGIYQNAGQTITVWVDAPDGVPLPGIDVAQYLNYCYNYQQSYSLTRGRNVITIPDFVRANSDFTYNRSTVSGGAIYITNPYTPDQQPGGVKVYIDGGYEFPLMTYETDVAEYRAKLAEYRALVKSNPNYYADVTELVANHAILTIPASSANDAYATRDPMEVLKTWDSMVEDILTFEGVALNPDGYRYDERVQHLNFNVRYVQAMGMYAAYAFPEIIGLVDFLPEAVRSTTFGWGIPHEVGHLFDLSDRRLSETTNNVIAKYYETTHNTGNHGSFDMIRNTLTSDLADTTNFWSGHKGCFDFWWEIECVMPGYWAKFENFYRYEDRKGLANTELMAYFSSLATGIDMSYYFERWGYFFGSDQPFKYANTSNTYKTVMAQAKLDNKFTDAKQYKIWYANNNTYKYVVNGGAGLYTDAYKPSISSVVKVGGGYKIILPTSTNSAHYGYEILQGNANDGYKVIGFTEGDSFIDSTSYESGYVPSYRIVAYDKRLDCSSQSDAVAAEVSTDNPVCRINQLSYGSLQQALYAAVAGDTIYLLDDIWEINLPVTVNVTIAIADSVNRDITITRGGNGVLFDVRSGVSFTLQGSDARKLILDGDSFGGGPLVNGNGATIKCSYVQFTNCKSSGEGGAIATRNGNLTVENCEFVNCIASDGGAIYANSTTATITSCKFDNCHAEEGNASGYARGGAICLVDCGNKKVTISSTTISNCSAQVNSGQSISNGGAIYVQSCASVTLNGTTIIDCNANYGGGIYLAGATLTAQSSSTITACSAVDGGGIFAADASTVNVVAVTLTQNRADNNGGGIFIDATSSVSINSFSTLSNNTASVYGGAIACEGTIKQIIGDENTSYLKRMMMEHNTAQFGGAIALIGGAQLTTMQNVTLRYNNANYGGAMYLEGSAWLKDDVMLTLNTASQFGGGIYYKGDDRGELKFTSTSISGKPQLYNDSAPIGYELYMVSGNLHLLSISFFFNYVTFEKMPTEDEMKYSLYVNSGNVVIAGTATPTGGDHNLDAELTRDIFLSQDATVHLTTAMFTVQPFYGPIDWGTMKYPTYTSFHITLDSYDFDCVKAIFTADFEIPQDALTAMDISFLNLDASKGRIEIRGNTICYVPNRVKVTLDYGEIGTESFTVENGSTYTFTADDFETKYPDKYIISFVVNGVTYRVGDSITIDDMTVIQVVVGQKFKVTVSYGDSEEIIYVTPGEKFKFPSSSSAVDGNIIKWEYNGSYYDVGDEIDVTEDIVILPVKEGSLRVEFRVDGDLVAVTYVDYDGTITMPSLSQIEQGYEFLGWYADDVLYAVGETVSVTKAMTFVASIEKIKLTVVYYNSSQLVSSVTVEYGASITLISNIQLEDGYVLVGWKLGDIEYTPGQQVTVTTNMRLVAMLSRQTKHTVTYYDGQTLLGSQELEFGAQLTPPTVSRTGYKFAGWLNNGVLFTATTMPAEDLVLTASWVVDTVSLAAKIDALKNATSLQAKFNAIKAVEATLALYTEEEIATLNLTEYNALKAAFDALSAQAVSDLAVAERVGESLTAKIVSSVALAALAVVEILKRRILG